MQFCTECESLVADTWPKSAVRRTGAGAPDGPLSDQYCRDVRSDRTPSSRREFSIRDVTRPMTQWYLARWRLWWCSSVTSLWFSPSTRWLFVVPVVPRTLATDNFDAVYDLTKVIRLCVCVKTRWKAFTRLRIPFVDVLSANIIRMLLAFSLLKMYSLCRAVDVDANVISASENRILSTVFVCVHNRRL